MQLSSNIIKEKSFDNKKAIVTNYIVTKENKAEAINEITSRDYMESYEEIARSMLQDARAKREKLLSETYKECFSLQEEAAKKGYKAGYDEGYKKAYDEEITKAKEEADRIINEAQEKALEHSQTLIKNANDVVKQANEYYYNYLEEKQKEIKDTILNFASEVLQNKIEESNCLNSLVIDLLKKVKESKTIIVRANSIYENDIMESIEKTKGENFINGEIIFLKDNELQKGKVIVETENGKVESSVELALVKLKEILNGAG